MASTKSKHPISDPPPPTIHLSDLLGALSQEFITAVNHHATMAYWKQVYESNSVLADYQPLGMKIVAAHVSLPVAVAQVVGNPPKVGQLTQSLIADAISSNVSKSKRQEVARLIYADLAKQTKLSFSNAQLINDLEEIAKKYLPEIKNPLNVQILSEVQRNFLTEPAGTSELSLLYRAKDLEQIKSELLLRIDLDLKLE